jgi:hypothetical protein
MVSRNLRAGSYERGAHLKNRACMGIFARLHAAPFAFVHAVPLVNHLLGCECTSAATRPAVDEDYPAIAVILPILGRKVGPIRRGCHHAEARCSPECQLSGYLGERPVLKVATRLPASSTRRVPATASHGRDIGVRLQASLRAPILILIESVPDLGTCHAWTTVFVYYLQMPELRCPLSGGQGRGWIGHKRTPDHVPRLWRSIYPTARQVRHKVFSVAERWAHPAVEAP